MQLIDYIGKNDFNMIYFSMSLLKDIDYKINSNILYYKNQVIHYIDSCIESFVETLHVKCSLQTIYKAEIYQLLTPKLNKLYEKHRLFSCL
ncbi:hypothetical protein FS935_02910 [Metabacillus litoralis]|uniref:Uncharacterized protein n=1 Tax=Metabacillus litoralis TaxID=152268 RepID=A0A5C6WB85_9BACI|nr:hypothetical protein [Metabacillus litoralis]TXC93159.1 hypothetical protein FS935_02910 [Metabacillus litoralis]